MKKAIKRYTVAVAALALLGQGLAFNVASAGMITTQQALSAGQSDHNRERVRAWLDQEKVRGELTRMGVDPTNIAQRIAALNDQELDQLAQRMDSMPAGAGLIGLLGVIFVVLIILDLVGVTHVFRKI